MRAREKQVQLVLLGILCRLGTGINQKQGWALRYPPRFDTGGRNYSDPHLQTGTSPRAQEATHAHKQTHAWVRGNEVKTGLNITRCVFWSWPTWLFCLFFKNINFTVQRHSDRQILIQNFKDYKVYSAHWSAEWNVRLFVLPWTEIYFRVSLPPPRRQSSRMMEHFFSGCRLTFLDYHYYN